MLESFSMEFTQQAYIAASSVKGEEAVDSPRSDAGVVLVLVCMLVFHDQVMINRRG